MTLSTILVEQLPTDAVVCIIEMLLPDLQSINYFCCSRKAIYYRIPMFLRVHKYNYNNDDDVAKSSSQLNVNSIDGTNNNSNNNTNNDPPSLLIINNNNTTNNFSEPSAIATKLWKNLYEQRWWKSMTTTTIASNNDNYIINNNDRTMEWYRNEYQIRLQQDTIVLELIAELVYGFIRIGWKDAINNHHKMEQYFREPDVGYDTWLQLFSVPSPPDRDTCRITNRNNCIELLLSIITTPSDNISSLISKAEQQQQQKQQQNDKNDITGWWIRHIQPHFQRDFADNPMQDPIVLYEITKFIAIHLLNDINYYQMLTEWMEYWVLLNTMDDSDGTTLLEQGTILIARFVDSCYDHSFTNNIDALYDKSESVILPKLDEIANELQSLIDTNEPKRARMTRNNENDRLLRIISILTEYIFYDLGVTPITNDYYNVTSTSIKSILFDKRGDQLTFIVLYKLLLHRINIKTDIIDIAGDLLLELPTTPRMFVDVCERGKIVSLEECQAKVAERSGYYWNNDDDDDDDDDNSASGPMGKLSTAALVRRMVQKLQHSCSMAIRQDDDYRDRREVTAIPLFRLQTLENWSRQTAIRHFPTSSSSSSLLSKENFIQILVKTTMPTFNPHLFQCPIATT